MWYFLHLNWKTSTCRDLVRRKYFIRDLFFNCVSVFISDWLLFKDDALGLFYYFILFFFIKYLFYLHVSASIFFQSFILQLLFHHKTGKNSLKKNTVFCCQSSINYHYFLFYYIFKILWIIERLYAQKTATFVWD